MFIRKISHGVHEAHREIYLNEYQISELLIHEIKRVFTIQRGEMMHFFGKYIRIVFNGVCFFFEYFCSKNR